MAVEANAEVYKRRLEMQASRVRETAIRMLGHLDKLREAVESAAGVTDPTARGAALDSAIRRFRDALGTQELQHQRQTLKKLLDDESALYEYGNDAWAVADGLPELENIWPKIETPPNAAAVTAAIKASSEMLNDLIFHCSMVTMPTEVKRELDALRVGKPLDFHQTFAAQLPDAEKRKQLLGRLKYSRICGWVDTASGLIYRLPQSPAARAFTCLAPFLVALLVGVGLWGFGFVSLPSDWDALESGGQLLGAYGLVLAGAVFHLAIENLKQEQIGSAQIGAISDGIYWLNLRWLGLSLTVFWVLVVTIGLRLSGMGSGGEELALYFFAGYSLDSVAGLVLTRFVSSSSTATKRLKESLAPAKDSSTSQNPPPCPRLPRTHEPVRGRVAAVPPSPRPIPRFIADSTQEGIPHGRFAERLGEELRKACEAIEDLPAGTEIPSEFDWFPERAWGGRVWVPATARAVAPAAEGDSWSYSATSPTSCPRAASRPTSAPAPTSPTCSPRTTRTGGSTSTTT